MPAREMIVGRPVLVVVDFMQCGHDEDFDFLPLMDGYEEAVGNGVRLVEAARTAGIPVVFILEVHSRTHVDFGRELDGEEGVHALEDDPGTQLVAEMEVQPDEHLIKKRRYSAFFGTDLEILLKGLKAETLVLCGGLTDVCVHYTYVDGHQHDYFVRVAEDAVIGSTEAAHKAALNAMAYLQTGALRSTSALVAAFAAYQGPPRPGVKAKEGA